MIRTYLKQAWNIIRQNRLFSSIYVIGTALAIAITMTLFVIYYVKVAPVYPEYNRWRTLVVKKVVITVKSKNDKGEVKEAASFEGNVNSSFITDVLAGMDGIEAATATKVGNASYAEADNGKRHSEEFDVRYTDLGFWKVFTFDFLSGRPFVEDELVENTQSAIISSKLAKALFASTDVTGRKIEVNNKTYRIVGVVKSPSAFAADSYAELFLPLAPGGKPFGTATAAGVYSIYFTAKKKGDADKILDEVHGAIARLNTEALDIFTNAQAGDMLYELDEFDVNRHWKAQLEAGSSRDSFMETLQRLILIVFSLLVVPAINLSSMISGRMEERKAEIGVRLAFGATRGVVMRQVLWENMLLTTVGGIMGFLVTCLLVGTGAEWVLTMFDYGKETELTGAGMVLNADMLLNPYIFMATFLMIMAINTASAWLPVSWALKYTISDSLNSKK